MFLEMACGRKNQQTKAFSKKSVRDLPRSDEGHSWFADASSRSLTVTDVDSAASDADAA